MHLIFIAEKMSRKCSGLKDIAFAAVERSAKFQTRYLKGVPFVNRSYMKGVPFCQNGIIYRYMYNM